MLPSPPPRGLVISVPERLTCAEARSEVNRLAAIAQRPRGAGPIEMPESCITRSGKQM
jgi:hypothetical protein